MNNFINANEIFPILDLIRREIKKTGLYKGGDDLSIVDHAAEEPHVLSVDVLREMAGYPALVTSVVYTYDNGTVEILTLERNEQLIVVAFQIEIATAAVLNEELESETNIATFSTVRGTITRENGIFKNLKLDYIKAV
ncbi:hypothetical protein ABEW34_17105 [Paenibacillus algorifonticola]|uniref:hypothetical protein n=1 Tax=Paenibacillus algorifonticola TaxID=684063 RepID=UPI003D2A4851